MTRTWRVRVTSLTSPPVMAVSCHWLGEQAVYNGLGPNGDDSHRPRAIPRPGRMSGSETAAGTSESSGAPPNMPGNRGLKEDVFSSSLADCRQRSRTCCVRYVGWTETLDCWIQMLGAETRAHQYSGLIWTGPRVALPLDQTSPRTRGLPSYLYICAQRPRWRDGVRPACPEPWLPKSTAPIRRSRCPVCSPMPTAATQLRRQCQRLLGVERVSARTAPDSSHNSHSRHWGSFRLWCRRCRAPFKSRVA